MSFTSTCEWDQRYRANRKQGKNATRARRRADVASLNQGTAVVAPEDCVYCVANMPHAKHVNYTMFLALQNPPSEAE